MILRISRFTSSLSLVIPYQRIRARGWAGVVVLVLLGAYGVTAQPQRPMTVDDIFKLKEIGSVAVSPDGQWLAYVLKRPRAQAVHYKRDYLNGNDRGDVWVIATKGGHPKNVTNGMTDGAGFWAPVWSPDSRRLAMLSTRGGNVRLWLWERASGQLRRLTAETVDNEFEGESPIWVSPHHMFVPVLPPGQALSRMTLETRAAERAIRDWPKAWKGQLTVSVIETGSSVVKPEEQGKLLLVDMESGASRPIMSGYFRQIRPSPDGRFIAFLRRAEKITPDSGPLLAWHLISEPYHYRAEVATATGEIVSESVAGIRDVFPGSLTWAPNGATLALVGYSSEGGASAKIFRFNPTSRSLEALTSAGLALPSPWRTGAGLPLRVSASGDVLVFTRALQDSNSGKTQARPDWWRVAPGRPPTNLTNPLRVVPSGLFAERDGNAFVGVAGGDLLRIRVSEGTTQNLTETFEPVIAAIAWPTRALAGGVERLIVRVQREATSNFYELDLKSGQPRLIPKPFVNATLTDFVPKTRLALFSANDRSGTQLWMSDLTSSHTTTVVETNTFLRELAQGDFLRIEYHSLNNQPLNAWILLPVGYQQGRRYPMVAWVYSGTIYGQQPPRSAALNVASSLNLQLLASHGYAVLLPSMPIADAAGASDPMAELPNGVLPAVDKAIEIGIADATRLGLMGQSYGGYSTYGLVTQTNRFKSAVALAGISNLISHYGDFDPRTRYDLNAHERMFHTPMSESGQMRMGVPPWKDPERYIRNSPVFFVDRVETPVMIIQGDMDYVTLQQGEQFFTGLYRQNKRASFVRYLGEGHVLQSPANIRDMWQRVFAWFDEFFKVSNEKSMPQR
jgi:dipeptidyl aminopeptidase/acylaminoacyl peptidase